MPHFIIETTAHVAESLSLNFLMMEIHQTALSTSLFAEEDIKVRIRPYTTYLVGGDTNDFIHVFAYIMEGRNEEQKSSLSEAVVNKLKSIFPQVDVIAMNVMDFERNTYRNLTTIER